MKTEGHVRESKYGSRRIAGTAYHEIEAEVIEIITQATFTILEEEGNPIADDTAAVAQVETVTLTGTTGTGIIMRTAGLRKNVVWHTSLTVTAEDFVTDHAAAYALFGITVTSSVADIIFTAATAGWKFVFPVFNPESLTLRGTTAHTTANVQSPIDKHGLVDTQPVGEKIYADTKFVRIRLSAGAVNCY
jgi:hypothetical protein